MNTLKDNNRVTLVGTIMTMFTFSHEVFGEKFYQATLVTERTSGKYDDLPIVVSERTLDVTADYIGCRAKIDGCFRSFNLHENGKSHLILQVFVMDIEDAGQKRDTNNIVLEGYLCKKPIYRKTPRGREIADILLAVNRGYGKSDYIPCLAWGRNAGYVSQFEVGTKLRLEGRIQSRTFCKKLSETEFEERTVYEVSISRFNLLEANE